MVAADVEAAENAHIHDIAPVIRDDVVDFVFGGAVGTAPCPLALRRFAEECVQHKEAVVVAEVGEALAAFIAYARAKATESTFIALLHADLCVEISHNYRLTEALAPLPSSKQG